MYQRDELLLIRVLENFQPVLDAEGYAECPDCEARIHCSTIGLANLEKQHHGTKTCLETKAKRDKNVKMTRNGSLHQEKRNFLLNSFEQLFILL